MPLSPTTSLLFSWAARARLGFEAAPIQGWFERWEPYDTLTAPLSFRNACTWSATPGQVVLVEPWYADEGLTPIDRAVFAYALHPGLRGRAAARIGEHFVTRVAFLGTTPRPTVKLGDPLWDEHVVTVATSVEEAQGALPSRLRRLLAGWGFQGHIELRPGGAVVFQAGNAPDPAGYDRLLATTRAIVAAAVG